MNEEKIKNLEKLLEEKEQELRELRRIVSYQTTRLERKQQEIRGLRRVVRETDERCWELEEKILKMQKSQEGKVI